MRRVPHPPAPARAAARRGLGRHRPRPAARGHAGPVRISDLVLAMLSLTLLGALGLMAGAVWLGRALGH